ncbi:hypothetical protein B0H14DRAFT_3442165 [Mycena olivaceomarginata]|nr:hypothetical protein B0H14DRAFT_3442165 [Mycena olivaceomarginata]
MSAPNAPSRIWHCISYFHPRGAALVFPTCTGLLLGIRRLPVSAAIKANPPVHAFCTPASTWRTSASTIEMERKDTRAPACSPPPPSVWGGLGVVLRHTNLAHDTSHIDRTGLPHLHYPLRLPFPTLCPHSRGNNDRRDRRANDAGSLLEESGVLRIPSRFALSRFRPIWDRRAEEWASGGCVEGRGQAGTEDGDGDVEQEGDRMRRKTRMRREAGRGGGGTRDAASGGWRGEAATDGWMCALERRVSAVLSACTGAWRGEGYGVAHPKCATTRPRHARRQSDTPSRALTTYPMPLSSLLGYSGFALNVSAPHPQHLAISRYFRVYLAADGGGSAARGAFIWSFCSFEALWRSRCIG